MKIKKNNSSKEKKLKINLFEEKNLQFYEEYRGNMDHDEMVTTEKTIIPTHIQHFLGCFLSQTN